MGKNKKKTSKVKKIIEKFKDFLDKWIDSDRVNSITDPQEKKKYLNTCLRSLDHGMELVLKSYGDMIKYQEILIDRLGGQKN